MNTSCHSQRCASYSLWASSPGYSGSRARKGRRACNYISGILNSTSNSPVALHWLSCQISANQRKAATKWIKTNIEKHMPRVMTSLLINVISSNQHFTSTFSMQTFKFQRRSCKLSFFFLPHHQSAPKSLLTGYPSSKVDYTVNHCYCIGNTWVYCISGSNTCRDGFL